MHLVVLTLVALLFLPCRATPQEAPQAQSAITNAPFTITFETLRLTHTGFIIDGILRQYPCRTLATYPHLPAREKRLCRRQPRQ